MDDGEWTISFNLSPLIPYTLYLFRAGSAAIAAVFQGHGVLHGGVDDAFFIQMLHHVIHGLYDRPREIGGFPSCQLFFLRYSC